MKTYKITNGVLVDAETGSPTSPPPKTNVKNVWRFWDRGRDLHDIEERFLLMPGEAIPPAHPAYGELYGEGETKPPKVKAVMKGGKSVFPVSIRKEDSRIYPISIRRNEVITSFLPISIMGKVEIVAVSGYGPPCYIYRTPLPLDTLEDAREWQAAGFSERMDVRKWMKALDWKGVGAEDAAQYIKWRYQALIQGKHFIIQDVPGIAFPVARA